MPEFGFDYTKGLLALLAVVYLLILYLTRPKPVKLSVPSLMFILKERGESKAKSFFRNFIQDMLLLLQFLAILSLAFLIAQPYTFINKDLSSDNMVFVIDISASSQVKEGAATRLQRSIEITKSLLGESNTIILAKDIPVIGVEYANPQDTLDYIETIKPKDTASKIGDAILLAGQVLDDKQGRIIVLSDFINTAGISPNIARSMLQSRNIIVDFITTATQDKKQNIGIVNVNVDEKSSTVFIKNYNEEDKKVSLSVADNEKTITIPKTSVESYSFSTPDNVITVKINDKDDFMLDNLAYISNPLNKATNVLLITNQESFYLKSVLASVDNVKVTVNEPPIISKDKFDIYLFHNINNDLILPGTLEHISKHVSNGSSVILHAQPKMLKSDYQGISPVRFRAILRQSTPIIPTNINKLTRDIEFGTIKEHLSVELSENSISLASAGNNSILAYKTQDQGKLFYYGLSEDASEFKLSPYYPIFWHNLLKFLTDKTSITIYNMKTGETLVLKSSIEISSPYGKIIANAIVLDKIGIYSYANKEIAVNLLDEKESDINSKIQQDALTDVSSIKPIKKRQKFPLELILLSLGTLFVLIELLYVKIRGDV